MTTCKGCKKDLSVTEKHLHKTGGERACQKCKGAPELQATKLKNNPSNRSPLQVKRAANAARDAFTS